MLESIFDYIFGNDLSTKPVVKQNKVSTPQLYGTIKNRRILTALKNECNIEIDNVFRLHKIMEKMGIIEHTGNGWLLTEYGRVNYTGWNCRVFNPDCLNYNIVKDIADYIKTNKIDTSKINRKW